MAGTKSTKIDHDIQRAISTITVRYPLIPTIVQQIHERGGQALLIGGAVRDIFLNVDIKDCDIEIHGLALAELEAVLRAHGPVDLVGKSYGVLRLHILDVDWSVPRSDSVGRKPEVALNPFLSIKEACARRDLTINAMAIDLITHQLIDPFNGLADLERAILRAPDIERFVEDPLRFFRVMQFVGRFTMYPDATLQARCMRMDIRGVSIERIAQEFEKLFLKSERPSLGIRWLKDIGRLAEILPELHATIGIPQDPQWHPEGNVFEHTMQSIDAAVRVDYKDSDRSLTLYYAALCHDLGKAVTTRLIDDRWRSLGHEDAGVPLAKQLLRRLTLKKDLIHDVCILVRYHMLPGQFVQQHASLAAYRRLAAKLGPRLSLAMLADLARADKQGRAAGSDLPLVAPVEEIVQFIEHAQRAHVVHKAQDPLLQGRDLLDHVPAGPALGELLKHAYQLQIDEGIMDKEQLKKRALEMLRRSNFS